MIRNCRTLLACNIKRDTFSCINLANTGIKGLRRECCPKRKILGDDFSVKRKRNKPVNGFAFTGKDKPMIMLCVKKRFFTKRVTKQFYLCFFYHCNSKHSAKLFDKIISPFCIRGIQYLHLRVHFKPKLLCEKLIVIDFSVKQDTHTLMRMQVLKSKSGIGNRKSVHP